MLRMFRLVLLACLTVAAARSAVAEEIRYVEDFALAKDRPRHSSSSFREPRTITTTTAFTTSTPSSSTKPTNFCPRGSSGTTTRDGFTKS